MSYNTKYFVSIQVTIILNKKQYSQVLISGLYPSWNYSFTSLYRNGFQEREKRERKMVYLILDNIYMDGAAAHTFREDAFSKHRLFAAGIIKNDFHFGDFPVQDSCWNPEFDADIIL